MDTAPKWKINIGMFLFRHRSLTPVPFLIAVFFLLQPGDLGRWNAFAAAGGLAVSLFGEMIRIMSVGFSQSGTSGRETFLKADHLNMDGIYSLVRNPLYLGNYLIFIGLTIVYCNIWGGILFTLFFCVQYYFIILNEEAYLTGQYGERYLEYKKVVPAVFPRFSGYQSPGRSFNIRKVYLKENDSIFNIFFMFILVMMFREYILHDRVISSWILYAISFALLIFAYILIKIFKKRLK